MKAMTSISFSATARAMPVRAATPLEAQSSMTLVAPRSEKMEKLARFANSSDEFAFENVCARLDKAFTQSET